MTRASRLTASFVGLVAMLAVTAGCSGGRGNPVAPSPQTAPAGFGTITLQSSAQCFQFVGDPACFSGARLRTFGASVGAIVPSAPTGLAASVSGSTVVLTWTAPAGGDPPTGYIIEAGSAPGLSDLANFSTGITLTTFFAPGVPAGTYYVRLRASNSSGPSAPSSEIRLVVGGGPSSCTAAPAAPVGLAAVFNSGGTVILAWTAAAGSPSTYIVEAGSTSGASNLANNDLGSALPTLIATGVGPGTYYVRIRAKNTCGTSAPSNEIVVVVAASGSGVSGSWLGLVASGDGATSTPNQCGVEQWDWLLNLTQTGSAVSGTLTQRTVKSGCDTAGTIKSATLAGTAESGTFSFASTNQSNVLILNGTFTASRMTGTGICNAASGGECGRVTFALNKQ